jgi:uncharacterized PurR-regulated membrane protein YhhQ (DUF165 family)
MISIPIDSLIFCWGAFGLALPTSVVWSIFLANVIVKGLVTLISLPAIYLVKEKKLNLPSTQEPPHIFQNETIDHKKFIRF